MEKNSNNTNDNTYTKGINYDIVYSVFVEIINNLLSSQEEQNEEP